MVLSFDTNDGNGTCTEADPRFKLRFHYAIMTLVLHLVGQEQSLRIVFDEWLSCGVIDVTPFIKEPPTDGVLASRGSPQ